jgi:integrase
MKWIKSKFQGVRYREHKSRKHGVMPDRYYTIFYKLNGKMIQESLGWASESWEETDSKGNKKRANWTEKRAASILAELKKNQSLGSGPRTLKEKRAEHEREKILQSAETITLSTFWDEDYESSLKGRIKQISWIKEVSLFNNWIKPALGKIPLKDLTPQDIEQLINAMRAKGLSPRTQQYALGTIFRIWKHAAKRKLVKQADNPAVEIQLEQINNARTRVLTPEELHNILEYLSASDPQALRITTFCAYIGCRFSEAARLTWEHISFERNTVFFLDTKNKDSREIHIGESIVSLLKYIKPGRPGELVFIKKDGSPYKEPPSSFKTAANNLGLNTGRTPRDRVSFHTLRHTAATMAARNIRNVKDLQEIFGWKTPSMVFRYVKGDKDSQKKAMQSLEENLSNKNEKIVPLHETA